MSEDGALEIADAVCAGARRAVDVVAEALARIERADPVLCAFLDVWEEEALRRAGEVDARVAAGERLPLAGVPVAVKGRRGLRAAEPLLAAGAVAVGATSVPGPGTPWQTWGARGARPYGQPVAGGPYAGRVLGRGGSGRGGRAGPAGDGRGRGGLGADPGGVVRGAGVEGHGRTVSVGRPYGAGGAGGSCAYGNRCGAVVAGRLRLRRAPGTASLPLTAVWSPDLGYASPDPEPVALARDAVDRLVSAGVVRLVRPSVAWCLLDPGPAWLALRTPGADPSDAHRVRAANDTRLHALFGGVDLLLTPTAPTAPHGHDGPGDTYSTALTWAFNLSGHPASSGPAGVGADGCPAGLQAVAARGREELLLAVAEEAERRGAVNALRPPAAPAS